MEDNKTIYSSVDEYIASCPRDTQVILEELRSTIKAAAPEAKEKISYQMPAFALNGILVWFAAHKNHIGFYPTGSGIEAFQHELAAYKSSKGAVRFPIDKPLPLDLISRMVKYRVTENQNKTSRKTNKK